MTTFWCWNVPLSSSNPDVWKAYGQTVGCELLNLDDADGWIQLVNLCDQHKDNPVVINTAARNNESVTRYGQTLETSLDELGRTLVTFWLINRQRDSLELLKEFVDALSRTIIHVVRNGYFGEERKFELYHHSKVRDVIESRGGRTVTLPDLADRVADDLYSKRLTLAAAAQTLPIGNRAELARWRAQVRSILREMLP